MKLTDKIEIFREDNKDTMLRYPDGYFNLIIVDPPYNISIDDWDKIPDYENYIRELILEMDRLLNRTGTMYFFGSKDWIATCKLIIEEFDFHLVSWVIWDKGAKQQNSTRSFADVTEHCLHFVKPKNQRKNPIKEYLNKARIEKGLTLADINRALGFATNGGGVASSYLGDKDTVTIPSENHYNLLKNLLDLDKSYKEFKEVCYTFNVDKIRVKRNPKDKRNYKNEKQIPTNVFYNQNGQESGESEHPTAKPVDIIRTLMRASSNKGDRIFSPFIGSGTDAIAAYMEDRYLIGSELDKEYYDNAIKRIQNHIAQLRMF